MSLGRAGTRPRATAIGATWGGIRARFAIFGYQTGTSPRATAIGAYKGDIRARCSKASRDRCSKRGVHTWGNNSGFHRVF